MHTYLIRYERWLPDGARCELTTEYQARTVEAALAQWDRVKQPGDLLLEAGKAFRMQWAD